MWDRSSEEFKNFFTGRDPLICPNLQAQGFEGALAKQWPGPAATGFLASLAEVPFPVESPYRVRPDLEKLNDGPLILTDPNWHDWVAAKRQAMAVGAHPLCAPDLSPAQLDYSAQRVCEAFQQHHRNGPIDQDGGFPWIGGVRPADGHGFFCALSLSLQEDVVLMIPNNQGELVAQLLSVCFASGWLPHEKLGMPFTSIHQPVAMNTALVRGALAMSRAMSQRGPFIRYVWTLAGNSNRSRHPGEDSFKDARSFDDLWFRCERQVSIPLGGQGSLFLIRVLIERLPKVLNSGARKSILMSSLRSMTPETIAYKGLGRALELALESDDV